MTSTEIEKELRRQAEWMDDRSLPKLALHEAAEIVVRSHQAEQAASEAKDWCAEMKATFDLRFDSDMRAIKRWQEATGRELVWPDHADLCVWLLEKLDAVENENRHLTAQRGVEHNRTVDAERKNARLIKRDREMKSEMQEAWKLVNAMAGQEPWDRAEEWLAKHVEYRPPGVVALC